MVSVSWVVPAGVSPTRDGILVPGLAFTQDKEYLLAGGMGMFMGSVFFVWSSDLFFFSEKNMFFFVKKR